VNWNQGDDVLMKFVPYSEMELAENHKRENQYYKVGMNLWYRKGEKKRVRIPAQSGINRSG